MNRLSLRTRLVALAVLLVAFAISMAGVATYVALHSYLNSQLEGQLQDVLSRPGLVICSQDASGQRGYQTGRTFAAALVGSNGSITQFSCDGSVKLAQDLPPAEMTLF